MSHKRNPPAYFHSSQQFLLQFLALCSLSVIISANALASPEINSKSVLKLTNNLSNQQQQQQSSNAQDAHLNSLNVYASNYDTLMQNSQQQQQQQPQQQQQQQLSFKPSYKLPEMETNFTPIQTANSPELPAGAQPVLMQYVSQTIQGEGGVQYLQLIPTRPLIVPINTYLNTPPQSAAGQQAGHPTQLSSYLPTIQNSNTLDYQSHLPPALKPLPINTAPPALPQPTLHMPYGLHSYTGSLPSYRNNYRYNREIRDKHLPAAHGISLNLNEYLPGQGGGGIQRPSYNIRGRP